MRVFASAPGVIPGGFSRFTGKIYVLWKFRFDKWKDGVESYLIRKQSYFSYKKKCKLVVSLGIYHKNKKWRNKNGGVWNIKVCIRLPKPERSVKLQFFLSFTIIVKGGFLLQLPERFREGFRELLEKYSCYENFDLINEKKARKVI